MDLVSITCPPQDDRSQSRRALFRNAASLIVSGTTFALLEGPSMANAASSVPTASNVGFSYYSLTEFRALGLELGFNANIVFLLRITFLTKDTCLFIRT